MKNRKLRIALIISVFAVFCVILTCWLLSLPDYKNNKKRIALQVDTDFSYKSIYISEASFGNDMTNLCRFTLKKPKQLKNFVPFSQLNKKKKDDIETFYNTDVKTDWGDHEDDDSFDSVNEELSSLRSSPKTRYIHQSGCRKLPCSSRQGKSWAQPASRCCRSEMRKSWIQGCNHPS